MFVPFREEAESVCEMRDSFSDSLSEESENEKLSRWDGCSSEEGVVEQDSLSRTNDRLGYLYFQYFERCTPYGRVPLMDKVSSLPNHVIFLCDKEIYIELWIVTMLGVSYFSRFL